MVRATIALFSSLCFLSLVPCLADDDTNDKPASENESSSINTSLLGSRMTASATALQFEGERALEVGNLERALTLLKRSMEIDDDDCNTRLIYAKTLEAKLRTQQERDPELFKECVKEWLIVMRDEVGDQKGVGIHGVSFLNSYYDDEDREMLAKKHLIKLAGSAPRAWETDAHYLAKVLRPSAALVKGKVVDKDKTKDEGEK
jgi:hypothetical protein